MKDYFKRFIGLDVESTDEKGNSLLNLAAQKNFIEGVVFLLSINADINT
jgi:hypothetical protein